MELKTGEDKTRDRMGPTGRLEGADRDRQAPTEVAAAWQFAHWQSAANLFCREGWEAILRRYHQRPGRNSLGIRAIAGDVIRNGRI